MLNVVYEPNFYEDERCELLLEELMQCPFECIDLTVYGKKYRPLRKVCAYADPEIYYTFSGATIKPHPWSSRLLEIKQDLEKKLQCEYNYVLLNLYENGHAKIGHHKDAESSLDVDTPIATLSLGATRTMEFNKKDAVPITFHLESGSLLTMFHPTNQEFSHAILPQPEVTEPRISLTFRRISTQSGVKRPLTLQDSSAKRVCTNRELKKFPIGKGAYATVQLFLNQLCIHVREYYQAADLSWLPAKEGVFMSLHSWFDFQSKIGDISAKYVSESTIFNNSILGVVYDGNLRLQQFTGLTKLSEHFITLDQEQLETLKESVNDINSYIIDYIFEEQLKMYFSDEKCENIDLTPLKLYAQETLYTAMLKLYRCNGCLYDNPSQRRHGCIMMSPQELFMTFGKDILMLLDVQDIQFKLSQQKFSVKSDFSSLKDVLFTE